MAEYIEKQAALKEVCDACGIVPDREKENCEYKFAGCKEYYNVFALPPADVRPVVHGEWKERRKHKWKRYSDGTIDYFAGVDCGYHNGPLCLKCGFSFCEHCHPEGYDSECPVPDYICTVCGSEASEREKYCPNCGADMREKNDGGL